MPHLVVEYSANLAEPARIRALCQALADCLDGQYEGEKKLYPLGGIRVRALPCAEFAIADGSDPAAAFVHANLKIARGRSEAARRATGDALLEVMKAHFAADFAARPLALSLEINEFNELGTWKHNNIHARLAAQAKDG